MTTATKMTGIRMMTIVMMMLMTFISLPGKGGLCNYTSREADQQKK
jgi:hypothetical protein